MNRRHTLLVSLAIGVAAVAGIFALSRTLALGQQAHSASNQQVARRTAQLARYEASLRRALAQRPPALPPLPSSSSASLAAAGTPSPRVVFRRPAPVVIVRHHGGEEHELAGAEADD